MDPLPLFFISPKDRGILMPLKWGKMDELCIKYDSQVKSVIKYYILNFIGSHGNAEGMPARRDE
jgi:hypothetical protein